jgi:hypothetical protein
MIHESSSLTNSTVLLKTTGIWVPWLVELFSLSHWPLLWCCSVLEKVIWVTHMSFKVSFSFKIWWFWIFDSSTLIFACIFFISKDNVGVGKYLFQQLYISFLFGFQIVLSIHSLTYLILTWKTIFLFSNPKFSSLQIRQVPWFLSSAFCAGHLWNSEMSMGITSL